MSTHHEWLRAEVVKWQGEGLVDEALAGRLLARYPVTPSRPWGRIVFSALGAVLIGLGVTLFFAYNWQHIPKAVKLGVVFAALLAAHGGAITAARRGASPALVEGLHLLGTMLFGAGIWLVAQVYHVDEHYPNAFLLWSLGALGLGWAMPSIVQGLLALALVAVWAGVEAVEFRTPMHAAPLLAAVGTLPLAWWRRSPTLLFCGLAVTLAVTAFAVTWLDGDGLIPVLLTLGVAVVFAGVAARESSFPGAETPARAAGLAAVLLVLFVLTFRQVARSLGRIDLDDSRLLVYLAAAVAAFVASAAALWNSGVARLDGYARATIALLGGSVIIALLVMLGASRAGWDADPWTVPLVFNALALGLAVVMILDGSQRQRPRVVGMGCAFFALVVVSRYVDLFGSLLARAAVFVALGAGLFLVGNFYARKRREIEGGA